MRVLDLFSGIGGFSLGLERAGMKTVAFCEIDPFCRRVLAKHWPTVPIYDNVRTLTAERLKADGISADVICGGFPCQDISVAGKGEGLAGERSGLWREYTRLVGEIRPRFVIVENVAALLGRGLGTVLGDLAALGYDAEWHCIPASAVGAPHIRDRVWIIAYPQHPDADSAGPYRTAVNQQGDAEPADQQERFARSLGALLADADRPRLQRRNSQELRERAGERIAWASSPLVADIGWWVSEPDVGRVAHGVPSRVDRLKSLGNAVVPQIVETIGKAILQAEREVA